MEITKKALIFDLDNTIYEVRSIADKLFKPVYDLLEKEADLGDDLDEVKQEMMRRPFQKVADEHGIDKKLATKAIAILRDLRWEGRIEPFKDFQYAASLPLKKYLVTTGFRNMQESKVSAMQLDKIFEEIHIIDPEVTDKVKKDVFIEIIERHAYQKADVVVLGDDPESEIKAGLELGVETILYDKLNLYPQEKFVPRITDFHALNKFLKEST
jgi:putative hydrolase of the HAD superfamily